MSSLWDDIRKTVKDGIIVMTDRTDEYAKIGRIKVDIAGINHNISKLFSELGGRVYHLYSSGDSQKILNNTEVVNLLERIKTQENKLRQNETEIKKIKKEKERERKKREQEAAKKQPSKAKKDAPPKPEAVTKPAAKTATKTAAKPATKTTKKTTKKTAPPKSASSTKATDKADKKSAM